MGAADKNYKVSIIQTSEDNEQHTVSFLAAPDAKSWKKAQDDAFASLLSTLSVPGFRPGKVSFDIAKKHISQQKVLTEAVKTIERAAIEKFSEEKKFVSKVLREAPKMTVETLSKESFALTLTFPVYPEVTLCDYKHIPLAAKRSNEVTEQEVDDDVNKLLKKAGSLKAKDENAASANGDTVNIDFVGYLDGEKFPGGEAKSYDLVLGSNSFIPGFEEQLVGKKAGEKVEVKLSFPKDYHASNLAGKETLFKVTVNEVFEMVPGTLDKEFFKKVNTPGITNEQELRDYLKKSLADWKEYRNKIDEKDKIKDYILANSSLDYYPKHLVDKNIESFIRNIERTSKEQGVAEGDIIASYLEKRKKEPSQIHEMVEEIAKENLLLGFCLGKLHDELKIKLTDEDFDDYAAKYAKLNGFSFEQAHDYVRKNVDSVASFLNTEKIYDKLIELNS